MCYLDRVVYLPEAGVADALAATLLTWFCVFYAVGEVVTYCNFILALERTRLGSLSSSWDFFGSGAGLMTAER